MSKDNSVSDEQLNAYIDGQLDVPEQSRLLEMLRDNPELSRRNCELQKVHELVKLTYQTEQTPEISTAPPHMHQKWLMGVAAALLVGFGVLLGWFGLNLSNHDPSLLELARTVHVDPTSGEQHPWRVMLHVSSNDPHRFKILLDETENLLKTSLQDHKAVEVEILTNGKGMELVRNSNKPYARRLKSLQDEYQNLVVSACNQTLSRLRKQGIDIELLPKIRVVPSAINEALARQKRGWTYIRI
jgi:intracellular sulfur oxidation DsrE/DsrF family protein